MDIKCSKCNSKSISNEGTIKLSLEGSGYGVPFDNDNTGYLVQKYRCNECNTELVMTASFVFTDIDIYEG